MKVFRFSTKLLCVLVGLGWSICSAQELQVNWVPEFSPERPGEVVVEGPIPLGDGRYRIGFSADQPSQYQLGVHYEVVGSFDSTAPVEAVLTFPNQASLPASVTNDGFSGVLGPVLVDAGLAVELALSVSQPSLGPETTFNSDRQYTVPSGPHPIEFYADVANDGYYELSGGAHEFEFHASPALDIPLVGHATAGGVKRHFQTTFDIVNRAPTLEHVAVNLPSNGARQLVLLANATDLDSDTLRYRVRWGDGSEDFFVDRLLIHDYQSDGPFEIEVTVFDYLDAFDQVILPFSFPAFTNQAPVVQSVTRFEDEGFEQTFVVDAYDPEAGTLSYRIDWGDGTPVETTSSPLLTHEFPTQRPADYAVSVWAVDSLGLETRYPFQVTFAAEENNVPPQVQGVHVIERDLGRVVIAVEAVDSDGDELLISVDWGDGETTQGLASRFFSHEYAVTTDRTYGITVTAIDPQGASGVGTATIVFEPFQNDAPIELEGTEIGRDGFVWVGQFNAHDPDGDELIYTIDFRDGSNPIISRTGLVRHVFPSGQYQTYSALVTASDGFGGQITLTYDIDFPQPTLNQPPMITAVTEILREDRSVVVKVDVLDSDGDEVQVDFEWGDGFELRDQTTFIAAHRYGNDANEYQLRVVASDSRGGQSEVIYSMVFEPPVQNQAPVFVDTRELSRNGGEILFLAQAIDPEGAALRYRWRFDDGSPDIQTETPFLSHEFPADISGNYVVEVRAIDDQGAFVDTHFDVTITPPPPNLVPVILSAHVINVSQYEVMVFIDAYDPENDELLYIFDWGDGSLPFETNAPFASYTYPENVHRDYPLSVMATDGSQQSSEYTDTISIAQPPTNQAPEVQDVEIVVSPRGLVDLRVIANDPEGDMFDITVDWGDATQEEETPILRGGQGRHRYAYRPDRSPYVGHLVLTDIHGASTETEFSLTIPDASTEINQTDVTHLGEGLVHISIMATDLDSPSQLLHSFDFDSDFVFERPSRLSGSAFYQYAQPGRYQVNVLLTDPWSGQTTTHGLTVEVPDWLPTPTLPSFERVLWSARPGGLVQLTIELADPDGIVEEVEVSWGDEGVSGSVERVINETMEHRYAFQVDPYLGRVTARTTEGVEITSAFEVRLTDQATSISHLRVSTLGQGRVFLSASAFDDDSPHGLPYVVDVDADGTSERSGFGTVGEVLSFNDPGTYRCRLSVQDSWSGRWTEQDIQFVIEPWIGRTQPPVIDSVQVEQRPGGYVELRYHVEDGAGLMTDVSVHWGDEMDLEALEPSGPLSAFHRYDPPRFGRVYHGFINAVSESGLSTRSPFTVNLVDEPTLIEDINAQPVDDERWRLNVLAFDLDSSHLFYSYDVGNDGEVELQDTLDSVIFFPMVNHTEIPVRVTIMDPWSGHSVEELFTVQRTEDEKNLPPNIVDLSVQVMPGGLVRLFIDARDPNNDRLTAQIDWGDNVSEEVSGQLIPVMSHRYAMPNNAYTIQVSLTDEEGLQSDAQLTLQIEDALPQNPSLEAVYLGDGWVMFSAFAYDPDGVSLYAFDVDGDGQFERVASPVTSWTYQYETSGDYEVSVAISDPWSGSAIQISEMVSIPTWREPVPIVDDHIVIGEGTCLTLSVESNTGVTVASRTSECEPGAMGSDWSWDMGDGTLYQGEEVSHRYEDQGTYLVTITQLSGGSTGRSSVISVLVQNEPPEFASSAFPLARAGEIYETKIRVTDPGVSDTVQVQLLDSPSDMTVSQVDDEVWSLTWFVPLSAEGPHDIVLIAIDGHETADGFERDGGRSEFQFRLHVEPVETPEVEVEPPAVEPGTLGGGGAGCYHTSRAANKSPLWLFLFGVFIWVRRRSERA